MKICVYYESEHEKDTFMDHLEDGADAMNVLASALGQLDLNCDIYVAPKPRKRFRMPEGLIYQVSGRIARLFGHGAASG
jgi:hypothetical protein